MQRRTTTDLPINEIQGLRFGLLSAEQIEERSVCEVNATKLTGANSVYDERMGVLEPNRVCPQCHRIPKWCTGHFGHIRLCQPILHPLFQRQVMLFLRIVCYSCCRLLLLEESMRADGLLRLPVTQRFFKVVQNLGKTSVQCPHCRTMQPKFVWSSADKNVVSVVFKIDGEIQKIPFDDHDVFALLDRVPDRDVRALGFEPTFHPRNLILRMLPVLPPVARPYIMSDAVTCDDDLTVQYVEIIKTNNQLRDTSLPDVRRQKLVHILKFRIRSLFDNSSGASKHSNGRALKGIKKRLTGKEGLIRNNLMGKRVDKSARSVIGPDPTLRCDEIAVPRQIAQILHYPVFVNATNKAEVLRWIETDQVQSILKKDGETRIHVRYAKYRRGTPLHFGDWVQRPGEGLLFLNAERRKTFVLRPGDVLLRHGKPVPDLVFPTEKPVHVEIGDVVERPLRDGDILLLNRQPTLHKGSMIAQKVRVREGRTIRLNLAVTKTFNADFDGDEMNLHCPASVDGEAELRELSSLENHLMSVQSGKPNITIVQDAMLGVYLLTQPDVRLDKATWWDIAMHSQIPDVETVVARKQRTAARVAPQLVDATSAAGAFVFSLLLPDAFSFTHAGVRIVDGLLVQGYITKKHLAPHASILKCLHAEQSAEAAMRFIDCLQFLANRFLIHRGFSVGISDCVVTRKQEIDDVISKALAKAHSVEQNVDDAALREVHIARTLSGARDVGMMIAQRALPPSNRFLATVTSGSKGDYFNIAQITGVIGQQFLEGQRVRPLLSHNRRTLPHYRLDGKDALAARYESRGFVRHSFVHGMRPTEFFFHAMTGREGITDTAMKTATSGYIQRRMVKMAEDVQVKYDGTVRNASDDIFQFLYGADHCDTAHSLFAASTGAATYCRVDRVLQDVLRESV